MLQVAVLYDVTMTSLCAVGRVLHLTSASPSSSLLCSVTSRASSGPSRSDLLIYDLKSSRQEVGESWPIRLRGYYGLLKHPVASGLVSFCWREGCFDGTGLIWDLTPDELLHIRLYYVTVKTSYQALVFI